MPRRKEHNIESNCVTFDDQCWDETIGNQKDTITESKNVVVSNEDEQWPEHWNKQL